MGVMIGADPEGKYTTWGKLRTPIFHTTVGLGGSGFNNLECIHGFTPADGGLFRTASWPFLFFWETSPGQSETAIIGAFAWPGFGSNSGSFYISAFNWGGIFTGAPSHNLDDDEIQSYWVGQNVVLNTGAVAMAYVALDGLGNSQTVAPAANNILSFDL